MDSDTPVCDLAGTLARMGDNVTLLKQLAEFCREDLPVYMQRLEQAIAAERAADVQQAAHSVKGLVVNFGAQPVVSVALRLERMGQTNNLAGAKEAYVELQSQTQRLLKALDVELARYQE